MFVGEPTAFAAQGGSTSFSPEAKRQPATDVYLDKGIQDLGDAVRIEVPTPYEVGPVNVYVIRGEAPTLIDVGPGTKDGEEALRRGLRRVGLAFSDIEQIVVTHTHVDHHGLLEKVLDEAPRAKVMAHGASASGFRRDVDGRLRFYDDLFARSGMPEPIRGPVTEGLRRMLLLEPRVDVDVWLHDGDLVEVGDGLWRVLHTPGHSGDLISLYREATRTLITSDHVLPSVSSNAIVEPPPEGTKRRQRSLIQYLDALRKVQQIPVELALPGHGEPFVDVAGLVTQRLAMHEARLRDIEGRLREAARTGGKGGATVFELASAMFQPREGDVLTLAMSEVIGHLDVLQARERIAAAEEGGVTVYRVRSADV